MPKDVFGKGYSFLKSSSLLSFEEIESLVQIFAELGVSKIRLTGGEPLLRKNLEDLIAKLARIDGIQDIAITTNASLLSADRAAALKKVGIKRINISLDALTPNIYKQINQIAHPLEDILRGVSNALSAGFETVKVNMVVQKGVNETDILPMARYFKGSGAILRFIEFMDVGNHNQWNIDKVVTAREIIDLLNTEFSMQVINANYKGEVAKRWQYMDGEGEIGIISSITQPFCGNCGRARLSAKGELFTCLFSSTGFDLKQFFTAGLSQQQIKNELISIWTNRKNQYSVLRSRNGQWHNKRQDQKVEMSYIGG